MMRFRSTRGATIAETAVTVSVVLLLLFGVLQVVMTGYLQITTDGAVFLAAHEYAIGQTNPNAVASAFPGVPMPKVSFIPASPPPMQIPVAYEYGSASQSDRHGGVQTIRPQRLQARLNIPNYGFVNVANLKSVPLTAGAVEARDFVSNEDFNVYGYDPNSSSSWNSMINPITTNDQNVPPYFIGTHDMWYCDISDALDNGGCTSPPYAHVRALGLAEYLDHDNYSTANGNDGVLSNGTFYVMACHQRALANALSALPTSVTSSYIQNTTEGDANYANDTSSSNPYIAEIYGWDLDITNVSGYPGPPLTPLAGC